MLTDTYSRPTAPIRAKAWLLRTHLLGCHRVALGFALVGLAFAGLAESVAAQEQRAKPPKFDGRKYDGVFYSDVKSALTGSRPRISELGKQSSPAATGGRTNGSNNGEAEQGSGGKWRALADPVNLEDEVKRLKLRFDALVTTPGRFKSGDFQQARTELAMLATVFAIISEYEGDVRFKEDAAIARDLMGRAVVDVSGGAGDAFDIAKQRKADLQDIVSGGGLNRSDPTDPNDWSLITTRTALMEYLDKVLDDPLENNTNNPDDVAGAKDDLDRAAAMVAVIGQVLTEPGMDESDDPDYNALSRQMTQAAQKLRFALKQDDAEGASLAVSEISQSCDDCHGKYR